MNRLDTRIAKLEARRPAAPIRCIVVWLEAGEDEATALERHCTQRPEDREGTFPVFVGWIDQ